MGAPLSAVLGELGILFVMGLVLILLGLPVFGWTEQTGKLKRTG